MPSEIPLKREAFPRVTCAHCGKKFTHPYVLEQRALNRADREERPCPTCGHQKYPRPVNDDSYDRHWFASDGLRCPHCGESTYYDTEDAHDAE